MALNNKQLKAIELLVYSPYKTLKMIAQEVGISDMTLYRWREENEEFKATLEDAIKKRWKAAEAMAVNTMINLSSEGNYAATKYLLDNLGYAATQKIDANVSGDIDINIVIEEE